MRSFTFITFILCSLSCFAETIQDASQDSLKGAYLKYVPDGSYVVKVGDIGYSDKNIAKSWLIIYAKTNEKCDGEDEKGILVLHQTHENEFYVACEDSNYFDPFVTGIKYGDGRISVFSELLNNRTSTMVIDGAKKISTL